MDLQKTHKCLQYLLPPRACRGEYDTLSMQFCETRHLQGIGKNGLMSGSHREILRSRALAAAVTGTGMIYSVLTGLT